MGPNYNFRSTNIYLVSIEESFLNQLKNNQLNVNLNAILSTSSSSSQSKIGVTLINFSEVLVFPQNKVQLNAKVMSYENENSKTTSKHIGNLSLWARLTCELSALKEFVEKSWSQPELNQMKEQTEIHQSCTEKLEIKNHSEKSVEQTISMAQSNDGLSFIIQRLKLTNANALFGIAENIYVAYSFLGHRQLRTETEYVLCKEIIEFNSSQTFSIDGKNHSRILKMLQDIKRSIKFNIVKDVIDQDSDVSIDSREIGFGLLHFGKIYKNLHKNDAYEKTVSIPVLLKTPPYQNIGSIEITISGLNKIQKISNE